MLRNALLHSLLQVEAVFEYLPVDDAKAVDHFIGLGVSRHLRHIYDHFLALQPALAATKAPLIIDYNCRHRESLVERDLVASKKMLSTLLAWCQQLPGDDALFKTSVVVISEIDCLQQESASFNSCIARELLYLINHTIHHVAYVKLLLRGVDIHLPSHIGVAPSTASYERKHLVDFEANR